MIDIVILSGCNSVKPIGNHSEVNNDRQSVVEVGNVRVSRTSQTHVHPVACLIVNDLSHQLLPVGQLTSKSHLLVVTSVLSKDLHQVVFCQLLDELFDTQVVVKHFLLFDKLRV